MAGLGGQLTSLLAPPRCAACGSVCDGVLCRACGEGLTGCAPLLGPGPPGVDLAVSAARFEGVARRLVHGLKYARRLALARTAAEAILRALPEEDQAGSVVAVPAAPWRRRWRGFDPAEEIAIAVADLGGFELCDCLRRARGPRQVGRRRSERLGDPPRVWAAGRVPGRALLVDDVCTTGATLSACALALRAAGCRRVVGLTLARAL